MYPKKKEIDIRGVDERSNIGQQQILHNGRNQTIDQFTQEIKERADVERLAFILFKKDFEPLTEEEAKDRWERGEKKDYDQDYYRVLAKEISKEFTRGLE